MQTLIEKLQNNTLFAHEINHFEVIETHISWVLLTGPYAYKIKKPIDPGFLDFTTLEKRKHFCEEELRLNKRLAPGIYERVVPICGSEDNPNLEGDGPIIEYAIQMKEFKQSCMLNEIHERRGIDSKLIKDIAHQIAEFHQSIESCDPENDLGTPENAHRLVKENFKCIRPHIESAENIKQLDHIEKKAEARFNIIKDTMASRKQNGFIREGHGDIHLANIAVYNDEICIFDCLEFCAYYRWIDIMSDLAFLVMDLMFKGLNEHAMLLLNEYLEITGDYEGLSLLNYYISYRAMVRAKVSMLRRAQTEVGSDEYQHLTNEYEKYCELADSILEPTPPKLIIMHGLSGSGKSTVAIEMAKHLNGIRIRSDVERKRLYHLKANDCSQSANLKLYSEESTEKTFNKLREIASNLISFGFTVIVDATFLRKQERQLFESLAEEKNTPFKIAHCHAPDEQLRQAILAREAKKDDASEATCDVLSKQQDYAEALTSNESTYVIDIPTKGWLNIEQISRKAAESIS